jgi:hypothetical protein
VAVPHVNALTGIIRNRRDEQIKKEVRKPLSPIDLREREAKEMIFNRYPRY